MSFDRGRPVLSSERTPQNPKNVTIQIETRFRQQHGLTVSRDVTVTLRNTGGGDGILLPVRANRDTGLWTGITLNGKKIHKKITTPSFIKLTFRVVMREYIIAGDASCSKHSSYARFATKSLAPKPLSPLLSIGKPRPVCTVSCLCSCREILKSHI